MSIITWQQNEQLDASDNHRQSQPPKPASSKNYYTLNPTDFAKIDRLIDLRIKFREQSLMPDEAEELDELTQWWYFYLNLSDKGKEEPCAV